MPGVGLHVGLTGGIGSGKSTVARWLAEHGAVVIDADVVAREVVAAGTPGLASVVAEFGDGVLSADATLDRARLGAVVFADADRRAALNAIVHPLVAQRRAELTAAAPAGAVVVEDVPLLVEEGLAARYDVVVVVDLSPEVQLDRLVRARGMTAAGARARIAAQASRAERLRVADVVLPNDGPPEALQAQTAELWQLLRKGGAGPDWADRRGGGQQC